MGVATSAAAEEAMAQRTAQPASLVMGPLSQRGVSRVVFYRLRRKFVSNEETASEDSRSIVYYTLSIGHHTGMIDCLEEELSCTADEYRRVLDVIASNEARRKLEGVLRCQEIQVDREHLGILVDAVRAALACCGDDGRYRAERAWLSRFATMLDDMAVEPAIYYMGRLRD